MFEVTAAYLYVTRPQFSMAPGREGGDRTLIPRPTRWIIYQNKHKAKPQESRQPAGELSIVKNVVIDSCGTL